ncbi:DUF805 domain-containing protein [Lentilactobacillus kisonensis]|uniref:DUF805 domain-containing protein n=2 Tax=Lentilactobacillus kisonensis TaxID=481722 RepID=H1LFK4_9LACO|nr:DUF805 domain-containing protein [Lentilactobacillus kisonensis]EHO51719.1 hypothetical protein HMPREF9104_01380 [Lentilactobacillus kisonensis F0435]KRL22029.1 hypothetical protein FC98_GL000323 [Lentilactobacillus kisonensis DSM 19906 = JCM 15041]
MINSYKEFWTHIFTMNAKANRSQYWWPVIINYILGGIAVGIIENILGHPLSTIYTPGDLYVDSTVRSVAFVVWIGTFTVKARRLHDTNRSAWWILIEIIPLIGTIWFFILTLLPGVSDSRWGKNQRNI